MREVKVRDIYTVDTISKNNQKAWIKLMDYLKTVPQDESVVFDFKGIEVKEPWAVQEFNLFMQDPRVHMVLWSNELTVNGINIMQSLRSNTKEISASRQSSKSMIAARPAILTILRNSLTRIPEYISFRASTSLVTRVTSLPTGVRSK